MDALNKATPCKVQCRMLTATDLREVLRIERASTNCPWTSGQFYGRKPTPDRPVVVALHDGAITGFLVYSRRPNFLQLEKLAVAPELRRLQIGTMILAGLQACLRISGPTWIQTEVGERNLAAQLFLRSRGFKAMAFMPEAVIDYDRAGQPVHEGAISFRYRFNPENPVVVRIAE